ncbi:UTP--glucose-1-phosphate uridylyltransferase-like [Garra rufa]|uniref:UTP--glucose-1-phosphate uridylyltransferase-like n=1 Tax=Garra rufa TaxID=137080 RepID=UPI003CCE67F6
MLLYVEGLSKELPSNTNGMAQFQEVMRQQLESSMHAELEKLSSTAKGAEAEVSKKDFEGFRNLFHRFLQVKGPSVEWSKINRPPEDSIQPYDKIKAKGLPDNIADSLNKLVVVKLNGGLGTSMGCKGPKSLISVRNENTFLDLTVQQIEHLNKTYNADVPLVLMNSFNTDEDTKKILQKYTHHRVKIHTFNQSRYPRINKESLLPVAKDMAMTGENGDVWYPPGHGDIYASFYNSGLLEQLIAEGKEYIFVSNIDNLGATVDLYILNHLVSQPNGKRCEFIMEVTDKTRADVKGGTLIQYDGKLRLLEIAQVPKAHVDEFKSVTKFKIFNTNNLWISLSAIKRLQEQNAMDMEIIVNPKKEKNTDSYSERDSPRSPALSGPARRPPSLLCSKGALPLSAGGLDLLDSSRITAANQIRAILPLPAPDTHICYGIEGWKEPPSS